MNDAEIVAVYDEDPARGKAWAADLGVPFDADLDAFLGRGCMDAVACNAPTNRHKDVMVAAAQAGKHIFTEKVMALTVAECNAIAAAVRQADVLFCISMPYRTQPDALFAKKVAEEKLIGDVTLLRVRVAHDGASGKWLPPHFYDLETCGGGAMMDLGAHPMYVASWIMGQPVRITSMFNSFTGCEIEDNAVSLIEFENKGIAISETSFVSTHSPGCLELYGTEGSLFTGGPDGRVRLRSNRIGGSLDGWITPDRLPAALPSPIRIWVEGILEGKPIPFGLEEGTRLTELMENAYLSYRNGGSAQRIGRAS
jgi:predicted dehydrogenase